jgi:hypothetical protein
MLGRGDIGLIFALAATGAALIYGLNLLAEYLARWVADVWASPHGDMPNIPPEFRPARTGEGEREQANRVSHFGTDMK